MIVVSIARSNGSCDTMTLSPRLANEALDAHCERYHAELTPGARAHTSETFLVSYPDGTWATFTFTAV